MQHRKVILPLLLAALALSPAASAHHSFAMFDSSQVKTLRGKVAEFRWTNPHVAMFVQLDGTSDREGLWAVELTSPGNLKRLGWSRSIMKRGDPVEVEISPLRDGRHGGGFRQATLLETGKVLTANLFEIERK